MWAKSLGIIVALAGFSLSALAEAPSYYEKVLQDHGIAPTKVGLSDYLDQLHPSPEQRRRADRLIAELGNADSFVARETAMKQLLAMPVPPKAQLIAASRGNDPEIRWRVQAVLREGAPNAERMLFAALTTIRQARIQGLIDPLLKAVPLCEETYLRKAAIEAVAATVGQDDLDRLRRAMTSDNDHVRVAAIGAISHVLGAESANELRPLLADDNEVVKLAAARAIADVGDRESLPALVELLASDSVEIRAASGVALRELTGVHYGLAAYESADKRQVKINQWHKWVAKHGKTAKLHFPLTASAAAEIGHTIIAAYAENRVIVLDEQKKAVLEIAGYSGPWGVQHLSNGNFLVNWYSSSCIVEYDSTGKEVWKFQREGVGYPWSAQRLANGNTLIAHSNVALEVDPDGDTVWQYQFDGTLSQAIRLDNGNTLVATLTSDGRLVEIDPSGKEAFQIKGLNSPYRIQRLANGNSVVVEKGRNRVVEFDARGHEIWTHENLASPDGAHRLANGNTLICDSQNIYEIDPSGREVWRRPCTQSLVGAY